MSAKTFAEYLPTMTAREREIVEAFHADLMKWHEDDNPKVDWPIEWMRDTPPAKEPVSVEKQVHLDYFGDPIVFAPDGCESGDRVRVVKIEETK